MEIVSVEFPFPPAVRVILVELRLAVGDLTPLGETAVERVIVPVKLFTLEAVTIDAPELPGWTATKVGLADKLKPITVTLTMTDLVSVPLVPRMLTENLLGVEELKVAVELALPPAVKVTLDGLKVTVTPAGMDTAARVTVPAKPLRLVTVTVDVLVDPALKLKLVGETETLKSVTVTLSVSVAESVLVSAVFGSVTV